MTVSFHWIKIKTVCYATEDDVRLKEMMIPLTGEAEIDIDISEGIHGNQITVMDCQLTHNKEYDALFRTLGPGIVESILSDIDTKIDDDCILYFRLDKQKAVTGEYAIAHGGDVVSITCKISSHPAKKESAVKVATEYFTALLQAFSA